MILRSATLEDAVAILNLHVEVARVSGGLARYPDEITVEYVNAFITSALANGIIVVAVQDAPDGTNRIVGELHASRYGLRRFSHTLTSLTVAVHPRVQGQGVGKALFEMMLTVVRDTMPEISRIELITAESNVRARRLYESVGFHAEGRLVNGILNTETGQLGNDIPMAWLRGRE